VLAGNQEARVRYSALPALSEETGYMQESRDLRRNRLMTLRSSRIR
jgi:hypothetical protein